METRKKLRLALLVLVILFPILLTLHVLVQQSLSHHRVALEESLTHITRLFDQSRAYTDLLVEQVEDEFLHLDSFEGDTLTFEDRGNAYALATGKEDISVTGLGSSQSLTKSQKQEMHLATHLARQFAITKRAVPELTWAYYLSAQAFIAIHPGVAYDDYHLTPADMDRPFYTMNLPGNNQGRLSQWTDVYLDGAGKGLMVTVAKPVYHHESFKGVMALDILLDKLHERLLQVEDGILNQIIFHDQGTLLVHSLEPIPTNLVAFDTVLPQSLQANVDKIKTLNDQEHIWVNGYWVVKRAIANTPYTSLTYTPWWQLVFNQFYSLVPILLGLMFIYGMLYSLYSKRKTQQIIAQDTAKFQTVFNQINHMMGIVDVNGCLVEVNEKALALIQEPKTAVVGQLFWQTPWWQNNPEGQKMLEDTLTQAYPKVLSKEVKLVTNKHIEMVVDFSLHPVFNEAGDLIYFTAVGIDITEKTKLLKQLEHMTLTDSLTNLVNRRGGLSELKRQKAIVERHGGSFGLILLDIDHFKYVNDQYGHESGDQVLIMVAKHMIEACRTIDTISRWGGEEFLVILPGADVTETHQVALRICEAIHLITLEAYEGFTLSITGGCAIFEQGDTLDQVINQADLAMYKGKAQGRDQIVVYET